MNRDSIEGSNGFSILLHHFTLEGSAAHIEELQKCQVRGIGLKSNKKEVFLTTTGLFEHMTIGSPVPPVNSDIKNLEIINQILFCKVEGV